MIEPGDTRLNERIVDDVLGCVGGGESDCDNKVRCDKSEQRKDEQFSFPTRKQSLKHRDRALPMRTFRGHEFVDRKCTEKGKQDEDECCYRRKGSCRHERNSWLIPKRRKIIDTGKTHYLPPTMLVLWVWPCSRSLNRLGPSHQPVTDTTIFF